jgi:hypothetical protein
MRSSERRRAIGALLVSLGLGLAWAGVGSAQDAGCKADIAKFCPTAKPGGGEIGRCLQQHRDELSGGCKEQLTKVAQDLKSVGAACEDDMHTHCAGVQPGGGRMAACLKQHQDQLSAGCKGKMAEMMKKR